MAILTGCCLVLAWLLWRSEQAKERLRDQLGAIQSARQYSPPVAAPRVVTETPKPAPSQPPSAAAAAAPTTTAVVPIKRPSSDGSIAQGENAEIDKLMFQRSRWISLARNEPWIAKLGLTPDRTTRLRDLMVARAHAEQDLTDISRVQNLSPEERLAAAKAMRQKSEAEIEQFLGPADFQRYQDYARENAAKPGVLRAPELQGSFIDAGATLSPTQLEQLMQVFFEENKNAETFGLPPGGQAELQATMVTRASAYLDPVQTETLRQFFAADRRLGEVVQQTLKSR